MPRYATGNSGRWATSHILLHDARIEVAYTEGEEALRAIREAAAGARDALARIEARGEGLRDRPRSARSAARERAGATCGRN